MTLCSSVYDVCRLKPDDRAAMFHLMERSYVNMRRDRFDADLNDKQWVILIRSENSHCLVGFSTQLMLGSQVRGKRVDALYSGDTVVDREHWGDPALASAWGNFALQFVDTYQPRPLFWFLTSKGFRTYRYLPLFFRSYFPRPETPTPAWEQSVIDAFGRRVAGDMFDPTCQIIRTAEGKDYVRPEIAEPGLRISTDPHVRFFVDRNPGFIRGDELCCLAPLTRDNFTRSAYRVIGCGPHSVSQV
jgi:hypothetical protein